MHVWTTPTFGATIKGGDLTHCRVLLTFAQPDGRKLTFDVTDSKQRLEPADGVERWRVELTMEQWQSGRFAPGRKAEVQANVIDHNGYRGATNTKSFIWDGNLADREA